MRTRTLAGLALVGLGLYALLDQEAQGELLAIVASVARGIPPAAERRAGRPAFREQPPRQRPRRKGRHHA